MPDLKRFSAVLAAKDFEGTKAWYAEKFDLKPSEEEPQGATYELGGSRLLIYPSQFAGTNQATAAGFEVDDVEAVVAELKEKGVTFEEFDLPDYKTEGSILETEWFKGAFFKDPEGNIISLGQRLK